MILKCDVCKKKIKPTSFVDIPHKMLDKIVCHSCYLEFEEWNRQQDLKEAVK